VDWGVGDYIESEEFVPPMPESMDLKETLGNAVGRAYFDALQNF
jgi:hypothetical protein